MKTLLALVAAIGFIAQLFVPASMITNYEDILQSGSTYKFQVRPIDPADPFRGRYVRLTFAVEAEKIEKPNAKFRYKDHVYALLSKDEKGLAKIVDLSKEQPSSGDYIKVTVFRTNNNEYSVRLPFNRYYAEESKAPNIETSVRENSRQIEDDQQVTADVRIKNGKGVISELYIGQQTIHDFLEFKN